MSVIAAQGVVSLASLPLHWQPEPEAPLLDTGSEEAQRVLQACMVLEDARHRSEDSEPLASEIERLHVKMNLVLDVLAGLLARQHPPPLPVPVQLNATHVIWPAAGSALQPGLRGWVSLYLHPLLPRPLRLLAVVESVSAGDACARFEPLAAGTQALLERYVFHHHRRAIAERRLPPAC